MPCKHTWNRSRAPLILYLNWGEQSAICPSSFTCRKSTPPSTLWTGGWVSPISGLNTLDKKNLMPLPGTEAAVLTDAMYLYITRQKKHRILKNATDICWMLQEKVLKHHINTGSTLKNTTFIKHDNMVYSILQTQSIYFHYPLYPSETAHSAQFLHMVGYSLHAYDTKEKWLCFLSNYHVIGLTWHILFQYLSMLFRYDWPSW